jgi:hypothetical protein
MYRRREQQVNGLQLQKMLTLLSTSYLYRFFGQWTEHLLCTYVSFFPVDIALVWQNLQKVDLISYKRQPLSSLVGVNWYCYHVCCEGCPYESPQNSNVLLSSDMVAWPWGLSEPLGCSRKILMSKFLLKEECQHSELDAVKTCIDR